MREKSFGYIFFGTDAQNNKTLATIVGASKAVVSGSILFSNLWFTV